MLLLNQEEEKERAFLETFELKKDEYDVRIENDELSKELAAKKKEYNEISSKNDERMKECQVIAATIDTCLARVTPDMKDKFDHIFLDEAGYCNTIKAATLTAFNSSVTFLGDHMQLPPVCEMNDGKIKKWENKNISYWAQSALYVEEALHDSVDVFADKYLSAEEASFNELKRFNLTQTFRFGSKLASVLAGEVYDSRFTGNDANDTCIYYIDACARQDDKKRTNSGEAYAAVEYCRRHPEENIAILTPYKNQRNLLKDKMKNNHLDYDSIYTIHGSQGREWDTVIFSVVDTHKMYFVNSYCVSSRGKKLINTAVSRARKKLIIVADRRFWLNRKGQFIEKLLSIAEKAE